MSFHNHPNHFDSDSMVELLTTVHARVDGRYVPARPIAWPTWRKRLTYAWWVLKGKADVITWKGQP